MCGGAFPGKAPRGRVGWNAMKPRIQRADAVKPRIQRVLTRPGSMAADGSAAFSTGVAHKIGRYSDAVRVPTGRCADFGLGRAAAPG
jgi:hypothetical protein